MKSKLLRFLLGFLPAMLLLLAAGSARAGDSFFGAIYTSLSDGSVVNMNLYDAKEDVYLDGGPQILGHQGLPDGIYYFEVTDPSGATLLSTDPAECRQLIVTGGYIAGYYDAGGTIACHHQNGTFNPATNATPVQLAPFADTPNTGGVYKVHLIRQTSTTVVGPDGITISFLPKDDKTDNFKVKLQNPPPPASTLVITKYYDTNLNGTNDGEPPLDGFTFNVTVTTVGGVNVPTSPATPTSGTDGPGEVDVTIDESGLTAADFPLSYTVTENLPDDTWVQTQGLGGITGTIDTPGGIATLAFGNYRVAQLSGIKYYDSNVNGVLDTGEVGIAGFQLTISVTLPDGTTSSETVTTGSDGTWSSLPYPEGTTFTVCELLPTGTWFQTGPVNGAVSGVAVALNGCWSGTIATTTLITDPQNNVVGLDFGNVCLGAGGGLTLGFWSNKNGQAILKGSDNFVSALAFINGFNRANGTGLVGNFSTYTDFRNWLLSGTATNMAYMLSVQMVTTALDVHYGFVNGGALVYAPGCGNTGVGNNFITISDLITAANASVGAHPYTVASGATRTYQECLKNALDNANNNRNFVQGSACPVVYPP